MPRQRASGGNAGTLYLFLALWGAGQLDEITQDALSHYTRDLFAREDEALRAIRARSDAHGLPRIHIRPEEGLMLQFLLTAIGARRVVEIGTLAGYSGTWMARALPAGGRLITLEIDPEHAAVARESFEQAGVADRVEVRVGHALESLKALSDEGPFDAVFIDAAKRDYPAYLDWSVENIRTGGLIMAHNAFWHGRVVRPDWQDNPDVKGLRLFNRRLAEDPRLLATIIPVGDGIAVAVRLAE